MGGMYLWGGSGGTLSFHVRESEESREFIERSTTTETTNLCTFPALYNTKSLKGIAIVVMGIIL
jgi:hypothetical protein